MKSSTIMCGFAGLLLLLAIGALCAALVLPHWVTDGGGHVNTTGLFSNCSVSDWSDDCNKNFDVDSILDDPLWLNIVRALLCVTLLLGLISFLGNFCYCCCACRKCILVMQFTCNLIATGACIGGVVYYYKEIKKENLELDYAHSVGIAAASCFFGATMATLASLGNMRREEEEIV